MGLRNRIGTDIVFEKYDWSYVKSKPNSDRVSTVHDTLLEYWIDSRHYIPLIFFFFPKLAWKYSNIDMVVAAPALAELRLVSVFARIPPPTTHHPPPPTLT